MAKRRFRRFRSRRMGKASRALKMVKKLKRRLKPEVKIANSGFLTATPTTAGIISRRIDVGGGTDNFQRVGNAIRILKWQIKGIVNASVAAGANIFQALRLIIFVDKQQILATVPSINDYLQNVSVFEYKDSDTTKRFKTLYDRVFVMDKQTWKSTQWFQKTFRMNMVQRYASPTDSDIQKNGIYVAVISRSATDTPSIEFIIRSWFTDV